MDRQENMRRIKGENTQPEMRVRSLLRGLGYVGYRLHRKDLPGKPDIAFVGKKKAIQVHGCFWHGHDCQKGRRQPKSNVDYWVAKIERNRQRDKLNLERLRNLGWQVLTIWTCELSLRDEDDLRRRIVEFMENKIPGSAKN